MTRKFLLASDFDQTLSFNDPGVVLSELIGFHGFHDKVKGLADINLVQQGAELSVNGLAKVLSPGQRHSCSSTPEQLDSASAFALSTLQPCRRGFIGKPIAPLVTAGAKEFAPNRVIELADSIQREGTR